jgi:four helix bundle protein
MKINRFEELGVWKDSKELVKMIYGITSDEKIYRDFAFKEQIRRAAISIMNNIAEGFERNNNKEFIRFLIYSKGSAGEVRSMLILALELDYLKPEQYTVLNNHSLNVIRQLANFIRYLRKLKDIKEE